MRRTHRADSTKQAIVDRLRACSVSVEIIERPLDLLICHRGETMLMEVKSPRSVRKSEGEGFTKGQVEFMARWPGRILIVESPDEAVRAVLGPEHCDVMLGDMPANMVPF